MERGVWGFWFIFSVGMYIFLGLFVKGRLPLAEVLGTGLYAGKKVER